MIPPDASAAFVADMEEVLEVYHRRRDPERPLVCVDETSKQLIVETRTPIRAKPGHPQRHDYEYERNGVANRFMLFAPLEGWRHVKVKLPSIMPTCSGNYPTCIFPTQQRSCWCRIISTPTSPPRFTKPSPPPSASARRALRMAAEGRVGADFQAEDSDFEYVLIDATFVRVRQHGTGEKGGFKIKPTANRAAA